MYKSSTPDFVADQPTLLRQFKAGIFQALAHSTRIFIVETLGQREMTVGDLCSAVGIAQSNASQHLAVLRNKHIVETRKVGNQIFYRLRDPLLSDVLEKMRQYFGRAADALKTISDDSSPSSPAEGEN